MAGDPNCKLCGGTEPSNCSHCIDWLENQAVQRERDRQYVARVEGQRADAHKASDDFHELRGEPTWADLKVQVERLERETKADEAPAVEVEGERLQLDDCEEGARMVLARTDSRESATLAGMVLGLVTMIRQQTHVVFRGKVVVPERSTLPANAQQLADGLMEDRVPDAVFQRMLDQVPEESEAEALHLPQIDLNPNPVACVHGVMGGAVGKCPKCIAAVGVLQGIRGSGKSETAHAAAQAVEDFEMVGGRLMPVAGETVQKLERLEGEDDG